MHLIRKRISVVLLFTYISTTFKVLSSHWHWKAEQFALALECRAVHTGTGVQSSSHWHWTVFLITFLNPSAAHCYHVELTLTSSRGPVWSNQGGGRGVIFDLKVLCGLLLPGNQVSIKSRRLPFGDVTHTPGEVGSAAECKAGPGCPFVLYL